ncbi:B3/B4 tRNA-binding domain-containing protein [Aureobasidium sp. EXF-12298]|nr:B3/B4 tRNA-binding domain-containing protein [Aureobasidium sp. EXF-12298]KAI4757111.1 B3/B4 tRNA-binding domain-containing protein [Aureobasidium sp. EXF-12344]KAI4774080.1 B3/B4 tRNA-binding domain-containing protein [Aureobasidium sp. EXF-3400]
MRSLAELQKIVDGATVAKNVFELRPDYLALIIAIDGIQPSPSNSSSSQLLQTAETTAKSRISSTVVTEIPEIKAWRETYKSFGAKPKKYQSSIEALTRRAVAGGLPRVNRLTDIYNAISVSHNICLGGEDLDAYVGVPRLIRATGEEKFETKSGDEKPEVGEVVWCDDGGVTCRNWNWRQCVRTQLSDQTTAALFILDALAPVGKEELEIAGEELVQRLKEGNDGLVVAKRVITAEDGI